MRLRAGTQELTLEDIGALQVWAFKHGHLWSGWIIGTDHRVAISSGHTRVVHRGLRSQLCFQQGAQSTWDSSLMPRS